MLIICRLLENRATVYTTIVYMVISIGFKWNSYMCHIPISFCFHLLSPNPQGFRNLEGLGFWKGGGNFFPPPETRGALLAKAARTD